MDGGFASEALDEARCRVVQMLVALVGDDAMEVARDTKTSVPFAALCREMWAYTAAVLGPGQVAAVDPVAVKTAGAVSLAPDGPQQFRTPSGRLAASSRPASRPRRSESAGEPSAAIRSAPSRRGAVLRLLA